MKDPVIPNPTSIPTAAPQSDDNAVQGIASDEGMGRVTLTPEQHAEAKRKAIAVLNELIETSKDGEKGFARAAKDSNDPALISLFSESERSCHVAVSELQDQVRLLGGNPEDGGSMTAAIHRGWISLKSLATSRDSRAILEECERGQDYAKAKYAEAVKQVLPEPVHMLIERQYQGVVANHDRVRDLRNRYRA
jgi:uncharacterized protein (TIGR02284 family)